MAVVAALGMMSGTSMDGVDAAILLTDGEGVHGFGPRLFRPYGEADRALLRAALAEARGIVHRDARPGVLAEAEAMVTARHGDAAAALLQESAAAGLEVAVIGFHGQTVFHAPDRRLTVQIGDGAGLARRLGLPVVHDFRAADVAAGGQGAPLVPVYHRALAAYAGLSPPAAFLNIGGVANVTLIAADGSLRAFDTGPGNAILDDIVAASLGQRYDEGGAFAASGTADMALVKALLDSESYFSEKPPKSMDRNMITASMVDRPGLSAADRAATAVALVAESVARAFRLQVPAPQRVIVCGGGARNGTMLGAIARTTGADVVTADSLGLSADFIEAEAFAYLAVRRLNGLPASFPETTGVPVAMAGGVIARP